MKQEQLFVIERAPSENLRARQVSATKIKIVRACVDVFKAHGVREEEIDDDLYYYVEKGEYKILDKPSGCVIVSHRYDEKRRCMIPCKTRKEVCENLLKIHMGQTWRDYQVRKTKFKNSYQPWVDAMKILLKEARKNEIK